MNVKMLLPVLLLFVTTVLKAQEAKYELKSAIIKKETIAMGQKLESTWYMDDYGKKESSETVMKVGGVAGVEKHLLTIMDGNFVINVDLDMKTASRMKMPQEPVNYLNLSPEIIEKFKVKENGEEEVAGKLCKKYSLEITQMGQTAEVSTWVWKGLVLKSEMGANGMVVMKEEVVEIEENPAVPADKFVVPEGITVSQ
ncbi:hypothetical protein [uncultured Parabacteroides sp.]|jgi:hypothetical protein|uniref:hypothetical protein n=1 Tax=uncultured Parabacteroides sp. TaxID=512312 RepID=UPI0025F76F34|nr:hypothetical protein [uncultured Parabacteroides sp.]